jgi:hypothetical protein
LQKLERNAPTFLPQVVSEGGIGREPRWVRFVKPHDRFDPKGCNVDTIIGVNATTLAELAMDTALLIVDTKSTILECTYHIEDVCLGDDNIITVNIHLLTLVV